MSHFNHYYCIDFYRRHRSRCHYHNLFLLSLSLFLSLPPSLATVGQGMVADGSVGSGSCGTGFPIA